jgi:hypothetical protein
MRWKIILQWFCTKILRVKLNTWKQLNTSPTLPAGYTKDSHQWQLYRDCATLPLKKFIECLCDENLRALVLAGNPPLDQIQLAWFNIYAEFIDLCASQDTIYANRLQSDINMFKARILKVRLMVHYLRVELDQEYIDELRKRGFRYKFDRENKIQYHKDLDDVLRGTKNWQLQLQLREAELDAYIATAKGEKPSLLYFTQILIRLSDHAGFQLNPEILMTAEFAIRKKAYNNHCDQVNRQKHGQR